MQDLPSSGQAFSKIRKANLLYIDKTEYVYKLIKKGVCYFLSRPRRFVKSLLLGTMKEIFVGNRELFKDLWIDKSDYDFKKYPVIHLIMSGKCKTVRDVRNTIINELEAAANKNNIKIRGKAPDDILKNMVRDLYDQTGEKSVILVDEYDAPILGQIVNSSQASKNREELGFFYSAFKTLADLDYLHFLFVAGITKFAKASVFSVFNNLKDLTLDGDYAGVCGFTLSEFETYFFDYLPEILEYNREKKFIESQTSVDDFKKMILDYYDGYSWNGETRVLNPFSLINFLDVKCLKDFWYGSATPTFLINIIKKTRFEFSQLINPTITDNMLDAVEVEDLELIPILFQTGYLTIDKVISATEYLLKEPNLEVSKAFNTHIIKALTGQKEPSITKLAAKIREAFETVDASKMAAGFKEILQWIPWRLHEPLEHYYHTLVYLVLKSLHFTVDSEVSTSEGSLDLLVVIQGTSSFATEFKYEKFMVEVVDKDLYQEALKTKAEEVIKLGAKALARAKKQMEEKGKLEKFKNERSKAHKVLVGIVGRTEVFLEIY